MGIKQDVSGKWIATVSIRHPITRQPRQLRRKNLKSKAEARRMEKQLYAELVQKLKTVTTPAWGKTVEEFLKACLSRGLQPDTVKDYRLGLEAYTKCWWSTSVDGITTEDIRKLIKTKVSHRSEAQQKNILKFIRGVFKFAVDSDVLIRNPTPIMKFKNNQKIRKVLTEEQVKTLLRKANELNWPWYPVWVLALHTGMRNGELFALTWDKVNFEKNAILVNMSWNNKVGFKSTKSGDDRWVDVPPHIINYLKQRKLECNDTHFVLPRFEKWKKGEQARELRLFLKSCGLPEIRFHDLRATWATLLLGKNVAPAQVMAMGGWKDMKTMMIYMRKAGLNIKGASHVLNFHNPEQQTAAVISLKN